MEMMTSDAGYTGDARVMCVGLEPRLKRADQRADQEVIVKVRQRHPNHESHAFIHVYPALIRLSHPQLKGQQTSRPALCPTSSLSASSGGPFNLRRRLFYTSIPARRLCPPLPLQHTPPGSPHAQACTAYAAHH